MKVDLADIQKKRTNLNAAELGDAKDHNPVFDEAEVRRMTNAGVTALTNMQCSDGGWGWFSGNGEHSWPHTTAVVVHGLQIARENDIAMVYMILRDADKANDEMRDFLYLDRTHLAAYPKA